MFASRPLGNIWTILIVAALILPLQSEGAPDTLYVDQIQGELKKKRRSRAAILLKSADQAFAKNNWTKVESLAKKIQSDPEYSDYGYYLAYESGVRRAENALHRNAFGDAKKRAESAVESYWRLYRDNPGSPFCRDFATRLARAELKLARAQAWLKNYSKSLKTFKRAFARFPKLRAIRSHLRLNDIRAFDKSCRTVKDSDCRWWAHKFLSIYPNRAPERNILVSMMPSDLKNLPKAKYSMKYESYIDPRSEKDQDVLNEAILVFLNGDYSDALESFQAFLEEYPKSQYKARALYWMGVAYERKGDEEEANKAYELTMTGSPLSYYGILAALKLRKSLDDYIQAELPKVSRSDQYLSAQDQRKLKRVEALIAQNVKTLALEEIDQIGSISRLSDQTLLYLATLNHQVDNHFRVFHILGELFRRGNAAVVSTHGLRLIFPEPYFDLIKTYSQKYKLDPVLVLSLTKQESSFRKAILSVSGAAGLMQLMPFTALDVNPNVEQATLLEPEENVKIGTGYLRRVLRKFDGNSVMALAGYNAGPTRAGRWYNARKKRWNLHEFIESIPYTETRVYVSAILRNYFWYSYRINGTKLMSFDSLWKS